jgi:hypothetical protein
LKKTVCQIIGHPGVGLGALLFDKALQLPHPACARSSLIGSGAPQYHLIIKVMVLYWPNWMEATRILWGMLHSIRQGMILPLDL